MFTRLLSGSVCLAIFIFSLTGCVSDSEKYVENSGSISEDVNENSSGLATAGCKTVLKPKLVKIAGGLVELKPTQAKYRGDILLLPAWSQPRDGFCAFSEFCTAARQKGFRVILPEMGKSIYTQKNYPETRADWQTAPSYSWLRDSLIPGLQQQYCMLSEGGNNFVLGLSSGARGAVRLAVDLPDLFVAAALLSGEYDPGQLIGDNIYKGFLGPYQDFPNRWDLEENLNLIADQVSIPLYMAHGRDDQVIDYSQTEAFFKSLRSKRPDLNVRLNLVSEMEDGYDFWKTEVRSILAYFEDTQANRPETP